MKVTVCIGSSCHLKGARQIVEELRSMIAASDYKDRIELNGAFCMGKCVSGVSVTVDGNYYSLRPENTRSFFEETVIKGIG